MTELSHSSSVAILKFFKNKISFPLFTLEELDRLEKEALKYKGFDKKKFNFEEFTEETLVPLKTKGGCLHNYTSRKRQKINKVSNSKEALIKAYNNYLEDIDCAMAQTYMEDVAKTQKEKADQKAKDTSQMLAAKVILDEEHREFKHTEVLEVSTERATAAIFRLYRRDPAKAMRLAKIGFDVENTDGKVKFTPKRKAIDVSQPEEALPKQDGESDKIKKKAKRNGKDEIDLTIEQAPVEIQVEGAGDAQPEDQGLADDTKDTQYQDDDTDPDQDLIDYEELKDYEDQVEVGITGDAQPEDQAPADDTGYVQSEDQVLTETTATYASVPSTSTSTSSGD